MSVIDLDMRTGQPIDGIAHLRQSIRDILTTPVGTRVMRRDYGSGLFDLIDGPLDGERIARIYAATAAALRKWEPRLRLSRVRVEGLTDSAPHGRVTIDVEGEYLPGGHPIRIEGIVV